MKKGLSIYLFLFASLLSGAQTPVGEWSDHLKYDCAMSIAAGSKIIYASNGSSVMAYDRQYSELRKLSMISGLTETGISTIGWSEENNTLIIAYTSSNIDLVRGSTIFNIPDIFRKYIPGNKTINRIRTKGRYAYLASSFGIVVIDLIKDEIFDTWKPGTTEEIASVNDIAFGGGKIYAATNIGVFSADETNNGLAYFGNWSRITSLPSPAGNYSQAIFSGSNLYVNRTGQYFVGDTVYAVNATAALFSFSPGIFNSSFDKSDIGFSISSGSIIRMFGNGGALTRTVSDYGWGTPSAAQAVSESSDLWIADMKSGLVREPSGSGFVALTLPSPVSNNAISISSLNGKTVICGGGIDASWNNLWRPLQVSVNEGNEWKGITSLSISDAMRSAIDPSDKTHMFISTWGGGLLEYRNDVLVKQYDDSNSPLQTIIAGKPYVRVCGIAFDKGGNLWLTQDEVPGSLKVLKPDGTWIVNPLTINVHDIGDIIITKTGQKWMVLPRGNGIAVFDDNHTPSNFADDSFTNMLITDSDNNIISYVYSIAEDLDGNIWIGTDKGPVIYYTPDRIFSGGLKAFRIKVPRNDGSGLADYMLGTETITSIAVDGANRKWLGTLSSGAYLLSADGTKVIENVNEENSPLFSNVIASLAVDGTSGNVWFATSKGIISYRSNAIAGKESFTNVYSFPNPVREDYTGNVTITGLLRNTEIRITDVSGNLVYKTQSDGGEASWDLTTYNGKRVATGVYMVFCASSDGAQSCVTKILVIH